MHKQFGRVIFGLILLLALGNVQPSQAQRIQATTVTMISPSGCPSTGCAAGQRLNLRTTFDLSAYNPATLPNVQVCFYTPSNWAAGTITISPTGLLSGAAYQPGAVTCPAAPTDYVLLGEVEANMPAGHFGDSLDFAFRIGSTATTNGSILVRTLEQATTGWTQTGQAFLPITLIPTANTVYVANDASSCSINLPCYVNSGDDLADGIGTGLKDAIDSHPNPAQPATIYILGNYLSKSNPVLLDKPHTLLGLSDSRLTYGGSACTQPMLTITAAAAVRGLTITDGACSNPDRDLIVVNSPADITVESNDLINGKDAVHVMDNTGGLIAQFNDIENNSGYAIFRTAGTSGGLITAVANNLYNNRSGAQAECNLSGEVEHNFWGFGVSPLTAASQCTVTAGKQLGAPGLLLSGAPGISAEKVTVGTSMTHSFTNLIGYQRSNDGSDFNMFIVNHGNTSSANVPFTGGSPDSLIPCSNYWDAFLAKGAVPSQSLTLAFRYDLTVGCTTTIETTSYCGGTDSTRYPLWWYDPASNVTNGWDTTGQNPAGSGAGGATGQQTSCDTTQKEIRVVIDTSGRPNYLADMNFTPFVVGLQPVTSSIVLTRFVGLSGDSKATIQWTTSSEVNTRGFYVLRSLASDGGFVRVSNEIASLGTPSSGANYEFVNTGLTNGTTYYYRLEIISSGGESSFSNVINVIPGQSTATPTFTSTVTRTPTVTPTGPTPTPTATGPTPTRTVTITRTPTRTRTPVLFPTYFYYRSPTPIPTRTFFPTRTYTPVPTNSVTPRSLTVSATVGETAALSPESGYPVSTATAPSPTTSGYPISATSTQVGSAGQDQTSTSTPISMMTPSDSTSGGKGIARLAAVTARYRPYLLGLLGLELIVLLAVGIILYRKGRFILPFISRKSTKIDQ